MKNFTLFIVCCFMYVRVCAQQKIYVIHPAYTNQVIAELQYTPTAYQVQQNLLSSSYIANPTLEDEKILVQKRMDTQGSFVLEKKIDIKKLSGSFQVLGKYWVINEDYGVFFKGGLVNDSIMKASDLSTTPLQIENCNMLIGNRADEYYLVQLDFLERIGGTSVAGNVNEKYPDLVRKKSLEKISSVSYTIEQYQSMIERCKELTANLIVHGRMAKKGLMNKKQLQNWKTDLEEAKKLSKEIALFKSIYESKGSPLNKTLQQETSENYRDFSKIIMSAAKSLSL